MAWVVLLLLSCLAAMGEQPPAKWVIKLSGDPQEFARSHNLTHYGPVAHLEGFHQFSGRWHPSRGRSEDGIEWSELQVERLRYRRTSDPMFAEQWHLQRYSQDIGLDAPAVWGETTGKGIKIAIVDDGLQQRHPDLQSKFAAEQSWDFNDDRADPLPGREDAHGTSCAGVCCAQRDNNVCGAGICPDCKVAGVRLISRAVDDATEAMALSFKGQEIDIYSCSWGPSDDGNRLEGPGYLLTLTLEQQTRLGRGGKGSIYIWAAGNGAQSTDNCNYDGYANSRFTIAIGALDNNGFKSYYSEPCSALFAVAPSSGGSRSISTTDLMGEAGYDAGQCTNTFGGTSSAAPLAAGVVGLLLQVRPDLTWRDVQHVIAKGATKINVNDPSYSTAPNPRGYLHSESFGFGNLVLPPLLEKTKTHVLVPAQRILCNSTQLSCTANASAFVEHVQLEITWRTEGYLFFVSPSKEPFGGEALTTKKQVPLGVEENRYLRCTALMPAPIYRFPIEIALQARMCGFLPVSGTGANPFLPNGD
jgi:subtilisin family serine protease